MTNPETTLPRNNHNNEPSLVDLMETGTDVPQYPELNLDEALLAIKSGELEPGTVITGFEDLKSVDLLAHNLGASLTHHARSSEVLPQTRLNSTGRAIYQGWINSAKPPSQALTVKNFLGKYTEISVVMLDDTIMESSGLPARNFVIHANMRVAGAGVRGTIAQLCRIGVTNQYPGNSTAIPGYITASYKKIGKLSPKEIVDSIVEESSDTSRRIVIDGLKHVFSAGLPGRRK